MRKIEQSHFKKIPEALKEATDKYERKNSRSYPTAANEVHEDTFKSAKTDLERIFDHKCAYCEGKGDANFHYEVEHYRPKSFTRKKEDNHHKDYKGYYWLAHEWSNFLLACRRCNGKKSERFPLENNDEQQRIIQPLKKNNIVTLDILDYQVLEKPLLLHPVYDGDVIDQHIWFSKFAKVEVKNNSQKGETSIFWYDLNRYHLISERFDVIEDILLGISKSHLKYHPLSEAQIKFLLDNILDKLEHQIKEAKKPFITFRKAVLINFKEFVIERKIIIKAGEKEIEIPQKDLWIKCVEEKLNKHLKKD